MTTQRDLSLAYSPGVAVPCEEIAENPERFTITRTGQLGRVISNGTAVLVGQFGPLGMPVMEEIRPVQTVCRCEFNRYRGRHRGPR